MTNLWSNCMSHLPTAHAFQFFLIIVLLLISSWQTLCKRLTFCEMSSPVHPSLSGLDMPSVQFVINYSVPLSEKAYRHRIGRTARAGQPGVAVTLVTRDVAHSFLELEASIVRYLPRSNDGSERNDSPCIPRWPVPLPGPSGKKGMLSRRRLADEAWSRASKVRSCIPSLSVSLLPQRAA